MYNTITKKNKFCYKNTNFVCSFVVQHRISITKTLLQSQIDKSA